MEAVLLLLLAFFLWTLLCIHQVKCITLIRPFQCNTLLGNLGSWQMSILGHAGKFWCMEILLSPLGCKAGASMDRTRFDTSLRCFVWLNLAARLMPWSLCYSSTAIVSVVAVRGCTWSAAMFGWQLHECQGPRFSQEDTFIETRWLMLFPFPVGPLRVVASLHIELNTHIQGHMGVCIYVLPQCCLSDSRWSYERTFCRWEN